MRGEVVTNMSVECRVGVVGASKVGKSSLINAFQGEIRTGSRTVRSVGGRMVAFRVVEAQSNQFEVETIDNVDVLLLCFSVAASLSALARLLLLNPRLLLHNQVLFGSWHIALHCKIQVKL